MRLGNKTHQWGGAAFMLGNLLFIGNKLNEMSRLFMARWMEDVISGQDRRLIILGQVALIIGYATYFWRYAPQMGRFGKNALRLFCGGGMLLALGHVSFMADIPLPGLEFLFIFVILGLAAMLIGLILFGIANLRHPVLARWQWLPVVTGIMGCVGFFLFSGEDITAIFLLFRTLFALGLIGLGLLLWLENPELPATAR